MQRTTIGLDIAKNVFHLVVINAKGKLLKRKQLRRKQVLAYTGSLPPCLMVLEACGGAHYWARAMRAQGHEVKLIAPQYVKPFVRGNKNDYNDAQAIAEAAQRQNMRFVPIKTIEQQDIQNRHRQRERLKKHYNALMNQLRGLLGEYGIVINKGPKSIRENLPLLLEDADNNLTAMSREVFSELLEEFYSVEKRLHHCDRRIVAVSRQNERCRRLETVHGIGELTATAVYAAAGDGKDFVNGRHFSAWLGLVPRQHSTGGKPLLLGISKRGDSYLRTLFIHGARSVLLHSSNKTDRFSLWAQALLARRGHNKACVAVANKLARIAWVILAKGEQYRSPV